jgi:hypothetical protein
MFCIWIQHIAIRDTSESKNLSNSITCDGFEGACARNVMFDPFFFMLLFRFPSKEDVLSYVVRITKDFLRKQPKTLIVVGSYSIGKECVYLAIAKALGVKIFANASRRRILQSFGWDDISKNLSTDGKATCLHVLPMSSLKVERLDEHLKIYREQYGAVLAFRPTGDFFPCCYFIWILFRLLV